MVQLWFYIEQEPNKSMKKCFKIKFKSFHFYFWGIDSFAALKNATVSVKKISHQITCTNHQLSLKIRLLVKKPTEKRN